MVNIWKIFPNNGFSIKNQPLLGNINHIYWRIVYHWFVVWNHGILWLSHHIGKFIIPTDELIFFRGIGIPPTSNAKWRMVDWWWLMINDTDDGNKDDTMNANNKYNQKNNWWLYIIIVDIIMLLRLVKLSHFSCFLCFLFWSKIYQQQFYLLWGEWVAMLLGYVPT